MSAAKKVADPSFPLTPLFLELGNARSGKAIETCHTLRYPVRTLAGGTAAPPQSNLFNQSQLLVGSPQTIQYHHSATHRVDAGVWSSTPGFRVPLPLRSVAKHSASREREFHCERPHQQAKACCRYSNAPCPIRCTETVPTNKQKRPCSPSDRNADDTCDATGNCIGWG